MKQNQFPTFSTWQNTTIKITALSYTFFSYIVIFYPAVSALLQNFFPERLSVTRSQQVDSETPQTGLRASSESSHKYRGP